MCFRKVLWLGEMIGNQNLDLTRKSGFLLQSPNRINSNSSNTIIKRKHIGGVTGNCLTSLGSPTKASPLFTRSPDHKKQNISSTPPSSKPVLNPKGVLISGYLIFK